MPQVTRARRTDGKLDMRIEVSFDDAKKKRRRMITYRDALNRTSVYPAMLEKKSCQKT